MNMNYSEPTIENSLPDDIALKIASLLQISDVCALGCCSRFWRGLCSSECLWLCFCTQRWPSLGLSLASSIPEFQQTETHENSGLNLMGWKGFYIRRHNEMARKVVSIVRNVELCSTSLFYSSSSPNFLELRDYQRAIDDLCSMKLEFGDVTMFLFNPNLNVFVNLIALSYCENYLEVPRSIRCEMVGLISRLSPKMASPFQSHIPLGRLNRSLKHFRAARFQIGMYLLSGGSLVGGFMASACKMSLILHGYLWGILQRTRIKF